MGTSVPRFGQVRLQGSCHSQPQYSPSSASAPQSTTTPTKQLERSSVQRAITKRHSLQPQSRGRASTHKTTSISLSIRSMTADINQGIIATPGEKHFLVPTPSTSPPRKEASNPQQGMADPAASVSANTAATVTNTACTSPLTVTSLEAAAAAGTAAASKANANGLSVPQVVSQVVPVVQPQPERAMPSVEAMLSAPMAKLGLEPAPSAATIPPNRTEEKKMRLRTPPTEHDNRKLFVGGLPTDVTDHGFLEFFQQFGEVIDSVVMVDRVTKRSRGFGFVTFATEEDANSLLTAIPGKTGYVLINGKQCEVKASTPKVDDGPAKHSHQGAPGMWRSNPPHDHRGYSSRRSSHGSNPLSSKPMQHHHQPRGEKHFYIDQEFNGDIDGRNFDELYQSQMQPQMNASYQAMNVYGRNFTTANPSMYNQNYQNVYTNASPNGYAYPSSSSAASVPSSWEASYPGPSQGYGQYPSNVMSGNNGYYDPYAAQQSYPSQYSNQYNSNSMNQPSMGHAGYSNYNSYYSGNEEESSMPIQGVNERDGGFEPYQPSFSVEGGYDQGGTAGQYE